MKKEFNIKQEDIKKILMVLDNDSSYVDYAYANGYTFIEHNKEYYLIYKIGNYIEIENVIINII